MENEKNLEELEESRDRKIALGETLGKTSLLLIAGGALTLAFGWLVSKSVTKTSREISKLKYEQNNNNAENNDEE